MAELSERDKRVILGDNFASILSSNDSEKRQADPRKWARERTTSLEGHRMTAVASIIVGLALVASTILTTKGETFWVQGAIALLFLALGIGGIVLCQVKLRALKPLL